MSDFSDFDRYCDEHGVTEEETPIAFAAWLHEITHGEWDGNMKNHTVCSDAECNICRGDTHVTGPNPDTLPDGAPDLMERLIDSLRAVPEPCQCGPQGEDATHPPCPRVQECYENWLLFTRD